MDGDGELDYVMAIEQIGGPILNSEHEEIRDQYVTKIIKINLSKKIQDMKIVPMEPVLAPGLKTAGGEKKIKNVGFRPLSQQPWLAYMGTKADSTFPSDEQDWPHHCRCNNPICYYNTVCAIFLPCKGKQQ